MQETKVMGYGLEYDEKTNVVSIYEILAHGETSPLIEISEEPLISFAYGIYTKEEIKEMSDDLLDEFLDFEQTIRIRKEMQEKFRNMLNQEREKLTLWNIGCTSLF